MTYQQIKYESTDGILTITLHRPDKLNAFTGKMLSELLDAMDRADRDDDVRAVVFTGAGRGFCAGADLSGGADTFNASSAAKTRPVITHSSACWGPTRRGRNQLEQASMTMARRVNTKP